MIRNLRDPLYKTIFEAQAKANLLSSSYIHRFIDQAYAKAREFNLISEDLYHLASINKNEPYVQIANYGYAYVSSEQLFEYCSPESINCSTHSYTGKQIWKFPGVQLILDFHAPLSESDLNTLRLLGHIRWTYPGKTFETIHCSI